MGAPYLDAPGNYQQLHYCSPQLVLEPGPLKVEAYVRRPGGRSA